MALLDLASFILMLINGVVIPLIFAVAFLAFIWGAYTYFISPENSGKREEGRKFVLSAVIGFFVMIAIWGIVNVVVNTFGFNQANRPNLPYFGGGSSGFGSWGLGGNQFGSDYRPDDCRRTGVQCQPPTVCKMVSTTYFACRPD